MKSYTDYVLIPFEMILDKCKDQDKIRNLKLEIKLLKDKLKNLEIQNYILKRCVNDKKSANN